MNFLVSLILFFSYLLPAEIYLSVKGAGVKRAKLAVGSIRELEEPTNLSISKEIRTDLLEDLEWMNLFDFLTETSVDQIEKDSQEEVSFDKLSEQGVSFFLKPAFRLKGENLVLEASFYDIPGKKRIFSQSFQSKKQNLKRIVHELSETLLKTLTGEQGLFKSRILMVCHNLKDGRSPSKEIYIANADGENLLPLTADGTLALSPAWMNDGEHISYTQFEFLRSKGVRKRGAVLKKHQLSSGKREVLYFKDGMNSGAAWSPNGNRGILTMSFTGKPELYFISPEGKVTPEPLSRSLKIQSLGQSTATSVNPNLLFEVEASWAPDGREIVFSSARTGHPMIYIANLETKIARRVTFAGTYNATPAWSPKGNKILFAAQRARNGNFDIYSIEPNGDNLSRITAGDQSRRKVNYENPSWAPTGRHFAVASNETGKYAIYLLTEDGAMKKRISPEGKECKSPKWGPAE